MVEDAKTAGPEHPPLPPGTPAGGWNAEVLNQLLRDLTVLRSDVLKLERDFQNEVAGAHVTYRQSTRNLLHYLALRRHDIRELQEKLAALGLSSLGRTESHALAGVEALLKILHHLLQQEWPAAGSGGPVIDFAEGKALLRAHTEALLGKRPARRGVRIMVTVPGEAARDYDLVRQLLAHGMDCMRINCAHDDAEAWTGMVANLLRAKQELGKECSVLMDIAGPKLRTGSIDMRSQVVKWRPQRDLHGRVTAPAQIWLTPAEHPEEPPAQLDGILQVPGTVLANARSGDRMKFRDLRGKPRSLELGGAVGASRWAVTTQTAYLRVGSVIQFTYRPKSRRRASASGPAEVGAPSPDTHFIVLKPGDTLILTAAAAPGTPAVYDEQGRLRQPAAISCTLPQIFTDVRPGERIWFDDGKIGGVIDTVAPDALHVRITAAKASGEKLRADKGINLPDSTLRLPALTEKDIADLAFVAQHADLVGFSFVKQPADVRALQAQLASLNAGQLGIVLKIETRAGFEHLPNLLLTAMRGPRVGVMIARGDLAIECGWERLAEVQEEILWVCEAAHVPVIWATQVLEGLAKKGMPSRAEITDAAMGERAECVMLNKGPHLVEAVRVLDDILQRMEAHQSKKTARLRPLRLSAMTGAERRS